MQFGHRGRSEVMNIPGMFPMKKKSTTVEIFPIVPLLNSL
jgi:hypothetical protein